VCIGDARAKIGRVAFLPAGPPKKKVEMHDGEAKPMPELAGEGRLPACRSSR